MPTKVSTPSQLRFSMSSAPLRVRSPAARTFARRPCWAAVCLAKRQLRTAHWFGASGAVTPRGQRPSA
eukprot:2709361-Pyramimonas_sp.AAC.1